MAVYFRLASREDIQVFRARDYDDARSLCFNLNAKLEKFLGISLSRDKQRSQFEAVYLTGHEPPQEQCGKRSRPGVDVLIRWKVQSIAGKVKLRFQNLEVFSESTCYMNGASKTSGRLGRYFVFYQPDDHESFKAGRDFTKPYTKYGRRYMRSHTPLTFLRIPYGAITSDEDDDIIAEYGADMKLLLQAVELVNATDLERKKFRAAVLETYLFASDPAQKQFLEADGEFSEADVHVLTGNADLVLDDYLCRLLPKLSPDLAVHGWVRYADYELKNRAKGTEVMICTPCVDLYESAECHLNV
jgi:hypothetical protein